MNSKILKIWNCVKIFNPNFENNDVEIKINKNKPILILTSQIDQSIKKFLDYDGFIIMDHQTETNNLKLKIYDFSKNIDIKSKYKFSNILLNTDNYNIFKKIIELIEDSGDIQIIVKLNKIYDNLEQLFIFSKMFKRYEIKNFNDDKIIFKLFDFKCDDQCKYQLNNFNKNTLTLKYIKFINEFEDCIKQKIINMMNKLNYS